MNRVLVSDSTHRNRRLAHDLEKTLGRSLRMMKFSGAEISLLLTSDREIARMNRKYRKINRPTDVLSFPQGGGDFLGDIAISVPTARRQARKAGQPLGRECALLAVHGFLHLIGHDHEKPMDARKMFSLQARILRKVGRDA